MPRIEPPKGYYSATQVKKILNISDAMVRTHVQKGRIKYLLPPGRKQGFYLQKDVDKLANELDAFLNLEDDAKATEFVLATEADIPGCIKLNRELFTASFPTDDATLLKKWTAWLQKNPEIVHVLKRNEEVVGIITMLPFKPNSEKFNEILRGDVSIILGDIDILPSDIEEYQAGNHILLYLAEIGVKPSLNKDLRRKYGAKIISNFMDTMVNLGRKGVNIESIISVGETKSGVRLLQYFGFSEIIFSRPDTRVFELDPKKSGAPIMNAYREALKQSTNAKP